MYYLMQNFIYFLQSLLLFSEGYKAKFKEPELNKFSKINYQSMLIGMELQAQPRKG